MIMKKFRNIFIGLIAAAAITLTSCSITYPGQATTNPVGTKVGKASGTCYLRILCFDVDYSIHSAAKNGGISKIATVDVKTTNVLGIIWTFETIVTGE
jgi:hypothetical protein